MENNRFTFIVVDYKNAEKTAEYINYLISVVSETADFIIVDNSNDKSNMSIFEDAFSLPQRWSNVEEVLTKTKRIGNNTITIVDAQNNLGYAGGNNLGQKVQKILFNNKYSVISNNDIKVVSNFLNLSRFRKLFDDDNTISIIGPEVFGLDGKRQSPQRKVSFYNRWILTGFAYPFFKKKVERETNELISQPQEGYVYRVMGSFFVVKNKDYYFVNGMDEDTFLYSEEAILSEKLKKINKRVYYDPHIAVVHEHSRTISKYYNNLKKTNLRYQSERIYYKKYCGVKNAVLFIGDIAEKIYLIKLGIALPMKKIFKK